MVESNLGRKGNEDDVSQIQDVGAPMSSRLDPTRATGLLKQYYIGFTEHTKGDDINP
jgi:hypothetical protein